LSIDADLLRRCRRIAMDRNTSLTGLIREYLEDLVRRDEAAAEAAASELEELCRTSTMVVGGRRWCRDDLHER
jgi:hypothetical protein